MIYLIVTDDAMPGRQILLWVAGAVWTYCLGMGVVQRASGEEFDRAPYGLVWPLMAPYMLGVWFVKTATRPRIPKATVVERGGK